MIYGIVFTGDQVDFFRQAERPHVAADDGYRQTTAAGLLTGERAHRGREVNGKNLYSPTREFERGRARATRQSQAKRT
jgi:hypothetical protein